MITMIMYPIYFKILLVVLCFLVHNPVKMTSLGPSEVSIVSQAQNVTIVEGDEVVLKCSVHNMGAHQQIVWRRGFEVIAAGPVLLKIDFRYSVVLGAGSSRLNIKSVALDDGGEFVCQVQTDQGMIEVKHQVIVQVPPSIHTIPVEGVVTAKQGESVSLRCNTTGVPIPTIAWHKSVGTAPGGHSSCGGSCYTIPYVDLAAGGDYICSAVNGVGHPHHATITLHVLYPPRVMCDTDQVQGGGGVSLVLSCLVHGEPAPTVNWFRDGQLLDTNSRRYRMEWNLDKRTHSLVVKKSEAYDFGNYSCVASNLMGTTRSFIGVHGRPSNLTFYSSNHLSSPHYYQVKWTTTSHYLVDMFTLLYRKIYGFSDGTDSVDWITVKIPGTGHHQTVQDNSWILTNLSSASSYECIVQAQNVYGWSAPSPIFVFHTAHDLEQGQSSKQNWDNPQLMSNKAQSYDCFSALITFIFLLQIVIKCEHR